MSTVISSTSRVISNGAVVRSRSFRVTSSSLSPHGRPTHYARARVCPPAPRTLQTSGRRSSRLMHAVTEPVYGTAPDPKEVDPMGSPPDYEKWYADNVLNEAAMAATSTFPIAPEVRIFWDRSRAFFFPPEPLPAFSL